MPSPLATGWRSRVISFATEAVRASVQFIVMAIGGSAALAGQIELSPKERLGKSLFHDTELSAGRNQSCAFCHAAEAGFTGPRSDVNAKGAVVEGSISGRFGNSKPPSAAYAAQAPVLYHTYEDGSLVYVGGAFWNGRASGKKLGNPAADQAQGPFLNPLEMALPDSACVVQRVCRPANPDHYPVTLRDVWGGEICAMTLPSELDRVCGNAEAKITLDEEVREKVEAAYDAIAHALAAYEISREVNPFSSKYDSYLAGTADLTSQEKRGLELFEKKGKCAECHVLDAQPNGGPTLLTDFTYDNLGVPRNPDNPFYGQAAHNPQGDAWVEQGLKVALDTDPLYAAAAPGELGKVKVPTLRNVDKRPAADFVKAFMHNGYFKSLKTVVHFYNTRDVKPRCDAPLVPETDAMRQGCWPAPEVEANLNTKEMGNLKLTEDEEDAIVAFMKTLTDGHARHD